MGFGGGIAFRGGTEAVTSILFKGEWGFGSLLYRCVSLKRIEEII
jgi:hypothetical protein